jgi:5-carboxyvanillate decarboxylase
MPTGRAVEESNPDGGYLRIATEEAFVIPELLSRWRDMAEQGTNSDPGFLSMWGGFYAFSSSERPASIRRRLVDLGDERVADMDRAGIDHQILSLTAPGTQAFDRDTAVAMATLANDRLADACRARPDRFTGLTAVAPQDPEAAAKEVGRGHDLGFKGVILNSHTNGEYLDDPQYWPIFEAAEALDTPVYLHPNTPSRGMIQPFLDVGLEGAIYGFSVETGLHLLRLVIAGVFDRFPRLKLVVGHLGEALPFWLYRLDYMHAAGVRAGRYETMRPLARRPSDYLRENVWVTTSGMPWAPAILFCRDVLGPDHVMYAMDYPYQYELDEVRDQDALPLSPDEKRQFFQTNAERVFALDVGAARTGAAQITRR